VDPNAAPWRSLDAEAPAAEEPPPSRGGIPLPAVAVAAGAVVLAVAAFLLAISSGGGSLVIAGGEPLPSASGDVALSGGRSELVVEIVGAVTRPGVYRLRAGTRIGDLVDAAGGYNPRVDVDRASRDLNLAALLADGDQVRVPSRDDAAAKFDHACYLVRREIGVAQAMAGVDDFYSHRAGIDVRHPAP